MTNRITAEEFMDLPDHEQYEILTQEGNLVELKFAPKARLELYAVDRFFVEVSFNRKGDFLTAINAFDTGEQLDKYSPELKTILTGILRT